MPLWGFAEPLSSWLHLAGAAVALALGPSLVRTGATRGQRQALGVFVFAVCFLLSMSGAYHLLDPESTARAVMRRLDHAAIWVLIAGTFTPVHVIRFRGVLRWGVLGVIWTFAVTGLVLKTVFFSVFPETLGLIFYLGLGWMGVIGAAKLASRHGWSAVAPLIYGGLAYSVGGAVSIIETPPLVPRVLGHHELFHLAVLAAIALHWRFIAGLAGGDRGTELESVVPPQGAALRSSV